MVAINGHKNNCVVQLKLCFQDEVERYAEMPSGIMQAGGESCTLTLDSKLCAIFSVLMLRFNYFLLCMILAVKFISSAPK